MSEKQLERSQFIAAMRNVASSVCVVTTDGAAGRHGATISAFSSVCADPPTVLICLNTGSKIAALVEKNRIFRVNILPEGAQEIAKRFAGLDDDRIAHRFEGIEIHGQIPRLTGATSLQCHLGKTLMEGTHLICIGRVQEVTMGAEVPLIYLGGQYQTLSKKEQD